jgi:glutamate synthase (NADPH/NADH) large chain
MVDVDPLEGADTDFLREVITRHHAETGSAVAARLLAAWESAPGRFTKVMPKDYKRVLLAASAAEREGRDVNEAVMAAAHG